MGKERLRARIVNNGYRDEEFEDYVSELLKLKRLDGDIVIGIAKKIVSDGVPSLSDKQLNAFINHGIWDHLYVKECGRCGEEISWPEMLFAAEEYGNCSYCQHIIDKDE